MTGEYVHYTEFIKLDIIELVTTSSSMFLPVFLFVCVLKYAGDMWNSIEKPLFKYQPLTWEFD